MSNEKHETLADIVREIRQAEVTWHRSEIAQLPTQYLKEWADRKLCDMLKSAMQEAAK